MHIKNKKRFLIFGSLIVVLAITAFFYFHSKSGKVILIGLDGADWDIIDHFIQEGKLPHFKRFKTEGAFGYLKSFSPMLSPVLWTTIATGKSADEHGIVDFLEWNEDQKTRIPVMSNRIQVRTLWDILGDEGFSVGVFNWLVSWPAQPVNGVLVSDRLSYHIFPRIVGDRLTIDKLSWPQDYVVSRQHLLASPSGITYEESKPFIHIRREEFEKSYETGKYDIKNPQYNLRMILSSIKTMSRLALEKIETDQPHFLAFYLDAPDTMMHTYMDYAPPKLDRVSKEDFEKYKDAVGQTYVYLDQILGDFLRVAHPNTSFVLISDHGFKFKDERLNTSAAIGENAEERWHDEHGIIAFLGPQFSIGKEIKGYDLYDVAPTLLYLMDQPLAQDMKGQIMSSAFKQEQFDIEKISYIASYERGKKKDQPPPIRSSSDDTLKEKLVSLGYVNQGELVNIDESKEKKTLKSHFDTRNPLLEAYHLEESGKTQEATAAYEKILQENPGYNKAYVVHNQLSLLYKEKKSFRLALNHIQEAIALKPELSSLYVNQGNILRDFNRSKKAVKAYEKALSINAKDPMAHYNLGFLYEKQKNWHKAQEEYRKAFDLNPKFSLAQNQLFNLLKTHGTQKEVEDFKSKIFKQGQKEKKIDSYLHEARELITQKETLKALNLLEEAQKIQPNNAIVYNDMGGILLSQGKTEEAVKHFEKSLSLNPGFALAYMNLGSSYQILKKWHKSKDNLEKASHLEPKNPAVYYLLGVAEVELNEKDKAQEHFNKALKLNPKFLAAKNRLGKLSD